MLKALLGAVALAYAPTAALAYPALVVDPLILQPAAPTYVDWDRLLYPTRSYRPGAGFAGDVRGYAFDGLSVAIPSVGIFAPAGWAAVIVLFGFLGAALRRRLRAARFAMPGALVVARRGEKRRRNP